MTDRLPLEDLDDSRPPPAARQDDAVGFQLAARASYLTPVFALAVGMLASAFFGTRQSVRGALVVGSINLVILGAGLVLAMVALFGVHRHGRAGMLWPAVIGIVVNLAFIGIIVVQWVTFRRGK